ncbi:gluconate 2-dehydrogenase subunit 3 family protein [Rufibacter roseus]|uniref:Gluconate 2-dehydrogenase subunit 3 family protein n=1 Tax=Rufibacter roseus TaxID=1567108 RepID=A0ABW2DLN7_9BACT|nr:gluconate 2-dehydrogenase subunit 3 family protein [Rufibacter roseus]
MDRRSAVKGILILTGGLIVVPSCVMEDGRASIPLRHLEVSQTQEKLLAEVVEVLLPATETPGAKDLGLHLFTLDMVDDCYSPKEQKDFMRGMEVFQKITKKQLGNSFQEATPEQRQRLIAEVNAGKAPEEVLAFYSILKKQTIKGYLNSELVMTKLRKYELVPSRYVAVHPVTTASIS